MGSLSDLASAGHARIVPGRPPGTVAPPRALARDDLKGRPPGSGSGKMSHCTAALRPAIALTPEEAARARALRRKGAESEAIAERLGAPPAEVEEAIVQMRSRQPETTRGTLNVTLAAHRPVMTERQGEEPFWRTMDRLLDELLRLRCTLPPRRPRRPPAAAPQPVQRAMK